MKKSLDFKTLINRGTISAGVFLAVVTPFLPREIRKSFLLTFLISFPIALYLLQCIVDRYLLKKPPIQKPSAKKSIKPRSKSYQEILNEFNACKQSVKKQMTWAYGCLTVAMAISSINALMHQPIYHPGFFSLSTFMLALLAATKNLEEEFELDCKIANCIAAGARIEQTRNLRDQPFTAEMQDHEGWRIWRVAFVRTSPYLIIVFSALNIGVSPLLAKFQLGLIQQIIFGVILGVFALFFGQRISAPYRRQVMVEPIRS